MHISKSFNQQTVYMHNNNDGVADKRISLWKIKIMGRAWRWTALLFHTNASHVLPLSFLLSLSLTLCRSLFEPIHYVSAWLENEISHINYSCSSSERRKKPSLSQPSPDKYNLLKIYARAVRHVPNNKYIFANFRPCSAHIAANVRFTKFINKICLMR